MIVIRFGLWRRQWHGKYEYDRLYLWGLPMPLCRRQARTLPVSRHEIPMIKTVGLLTGGEHDKETEKRREST